MKGTSPDCADSLPREQGNAAADRITRPATPARSTAPPGITPEIVAVIEAAASQFVGGKVRILSIRMQSELPTTSGSWAEQGRDIIQTSHNLVQRGR